MICTNSELPQWIVILVALRMDNLPEGFAHFKIKAILLIVDTHLLSVIYLFIILEIVCQLGCHYFKTWYHVHVP